MLRHWAQVPSYANFIFDSRSMISLHNQDYQLCYSSTDKLIRCFVGISIFSPSFSCINYELHLKIKLSHRGGLHTEFRGSNRNSFEPWNKYRGEIRYNGERLTFTIRMTFPLSKEMIAPPQASIQ